MARPDQQPKESNGQAGRQANIFEPHINVCYKKNKKKKYRQHNTPEHTNEQTLPFLYFIVQYTDTHTQTHTETHLLTD